MTQFDPTTAPVPAEELEPMLLLDRTGSMKWPAAAGSPVSRVSVVHEAIRIVVTALAEHDSQAAREEDGGGLHTVTFAGGSATDIGDLNPANLNAKWAAIPWGDSTWIMPGLKTIQRVYAQEFKNRPIDERPKLLMLVITDGEADDISAFADTISTVSGGMYVQLAIIGYGADHDSALASFARIAETNKHVKVTSFDSETDPAMLAAGLLRMIA